MMSKKSRLFTALTIFAVFSLFISPFIYACTGNTGSGSEGNGQSNQGEVQAQNQEQNQNQNQNQEPNSSPAQNSQNNQNQSQNQVLGSQNSENSQGPNAPVPGPDFINICHKTQSENNPWQAIRIDTSAWPQHEKHGDYKPYEGPMKENGHPDNSNYWADDWCGDYAPSPEPTPTPTPSTSTTTTTSTGVGGSTADDDNTWHCPSQTPTSAPVLTIDQIRTNSVVLKWTAVEPVTHYIIRYGLNAGNYQFGVPNTSNTTTFEIKDLEEEKTYYFQVAGVNNCAPGPWSNEASKRSRLVLGASTIGYVLGAFHSPVGAGLVGPDFLELASKIGVLGIVFFGLSRLTKRVYLFGR